MTCQKTIESKMARGVSLLAPFARPFPTTGIPKAHQGSQATLQLGAVLPVLSASPLRGGREQAARTTPRTGRFPARGVVFC
jgi:hypothetical protein